MVVSAITVPAEGSLLVPVELRPAVHYRLRGFFCATASIQNGPADVTQAWIGTVLRQKGVLAVGQTNAAAPTAMFEVQMDPPTALVSVQ